MNELVRSIFQSKPLAALRLPSFAGEGLPERMRSISFALLGLTAAAGLALVAIFAQPGFKLLSPAPLPDQPGAGQSIAEAERLPVEHRLASLGPARPAPRPYGGGSSTSESPSGPSGSAGDNDGPSTTPGGADAPAPVGTPAP